MASLVGVGFRFVRADATSRKLGIIIGNAVASLLISALAALPDALSPGAAELDPSARAIVAVVIAFVAIPVSMLLVTVGRVSAASRDRRLAALRLLGLSPARTLAVAMIENTALALTGAVAGVTFFALLAPAASAAVRAGPRWFAGSWALSLLWLAVIAAAVGLLSAAAAVAPARRLRTEPKALREGGTRNRPGWWRLGVFGVGAGLLIWIGTGPRYLSYQADAGVTVGGVAAAVVGLALSVPLLSDRAGRWLARSRRTVPLMAGRGILAEPSSGTRLVLGLGAAVFLAVAGAGQLWSMENSGAMAWGRRVLVDGPQLMRFSPVGSDLARSYSEGDDSLSLIPDFWGETRDEYSVPRVTSAQFQGLSELDGISTVLGHWTFSDPAAPFDGSVCDPGSEFCGSEVFVGTCADLVAFNPAATNCSDQEVRWMAAAPRPESQHDPLSRPRTDTVTVRLADPVDGARIGDGVEFALSNQVIGFPPIPLRDEGKPWEPYGEGLFIPAGLAWDAFGAPPELWALAGGGLPVADRLAAAAESLELVGGTENLRYYREEMTLLTGFRLLYALAIVVAVINLGITGIDRAKERRNTLARQIALGVPLPVLRRAWVLQVLVPLLGAVALGIVGGGAALVRYGLPGWRTGATELPWPQLGTALGATVLGAGLVVGLTAALARTRLTPQALRRE
ncbi:MAG: FtsX-like permease family protein [Bifidobacteriaceae bacterium]|jgi:hypothetical protein|nr:FtsX-like permease family protein [Bifidobacteriaceae bacterium]